MYLELNSWKHLLRNAMRLDRRSKQWANALPELASLLILVANKDSRVSLVEIVLWQWSVDSVHLDPRILGSARANALARQKQFGSWYPPYMMRRLRRKFLSTFPLLRIDIITPGTGTAHANPRRKTEGRESSNFAKRCHNKRLRGQNS